MIDTRKTGYPIFFTEPPAVGTKIVYSGGHIATLISVSEYPKADGTTSALLEWSFEDGRVGTSGIRGKGVHWTSAEEARARARALRDGLDLNDGCFIQRVAR